MNRTFAAVAVIGGLFASACHRAPPPPDLGTVPNFSMTDELGKPFTNTTLAGKTWAAAFVFTRCPTACPRVTRLMRRLQEQAESRHLDLRFVSFSIDPDNDTPSVLKQYAAQYGADLATWSFVTGGDSDKVKATAEQGFKIAVDGKPDPSKTNLGLSHGTELVLVDGGGKIRGYYATNDDTEAFRILDDAARISSS